MQPKRGFTLIEVMVVLTLGLLLLGAVYRLFFSQVRTIRFALEHVSVNENARVFLSSFGNDVRNANWIELPAPLGRENVRNLGPCGPGVVCRLLGQTPRWDKKPPDPAFLRQTEITYSLRRDRFGRYELWRKVGGDQVPGGERGERRLCEGVRELRLFLTRKNPVQTSNFIGLPLKNALIFPAYEQDGTGPYLVHARVTFVRPHLPPSPKDDTAAMTLRSCFALRGRRMWVHP